MPFSTWVTKLRLGTRKRSNFLISFTADAIWARYQTLRYRRVNSNPGAVSTCSWSRSPASVGASVSWVKGQPQHIDQVSKEATNWSHGFVIVLDILAGHMYVQIDLSEVDEGDLVVAFDLVTDLVELHVNGEFACSLFVEDISCFEIILARYQQDWRGFLSRWLCSALLVSTGGEEASDFPRARLQYQFKDVLAELKWQFKEVEAAGPVIRKRETLMLEYCFYAKSDWRSRCLSARVRVAISSWTWEKLAFIFGWSGWGCPLRLATTTDMVFVVEQSENVEVFKKKRCSK